MIIFSKLYLVILAYKTKGIIFFVSGRKFTATSLIRMVLLKSICNETLH